MTVHDTSGHVLSYARFGINDEPVSVDGYHKTSFEYDSLGYINSRYWFGTSGKAIEIDGIHRQAVTYDKNGNITSLSYFDKEHNPAIKMDYHMAKMWYDSLNREVRSEFYGALYEPTSSAYGYFRKITKYGDRKAGERIEYYYDKKGSLINIRK